MGVEQALGGPAAARGQPPCLCFLITHPPTHTTRSCVHPSDPEYQDNLHFFLEFGVRPGDGCDYLLVVQEVGRGGWGAVQRWQLAASSDEAERPGD